MRRCNGTRCMAWGFAGLAVVWGCGTEPTPPVSVPIAVMVSPQTVSVFTGRSQDFSAAVTNDPAAQGVTWSIAGCTGGAAVCGSLTHVTSTAATYTAPAMPPPGSLGVTATSVADNTKSFTATVAIGASGEIAFVSTRDGNAEIYVMNADGSGLQNLTNDPGMDYWPAWSPDGTRIAFSSAGHLYVMNAGGSERREVRPADPTAQSLQEPAWSPDGMMLAASGVFRHYVCGRDCTLQFFSQLFVMSVHGGNVDPVFARQTGYRPVYYQYQPAWSPNADIAYAWGGVLILVRYPDGTSRNLTNTGSDNGPAWSPDGKKVAFRSNRSGHSDLYVMNADGSGVTQLTADSATEGRPAWSPDGMKIAFGRTPSDLMAWELYVMNADGSGVTQLTTNNGSVDPKPAWSP
jgi:dipeptidyl aminopeptidase/acylaminoacyl peptidase